MGASFTEGIWTYKDGCVLADGIAPICTVNQADDFPCVSEGEADSLQEECDANGNLLAAAPDLHKTLQRMLHLCSETFLDEDEMAPEWRELCAEAKAALRKVEGEKS